MTLPWDVIVQDRAKQEYYDSLEWYSERSPSAAEAFSKEVNYAVDLICAAPHRWPVFDADFHEFVLTKFPYTVVYRMDEPKNVVLIVSIFHHKRHPKRKLNP